MKSRAQIDQELKNLEDRKKEQHRRDDYLLDDPGGGLLADSRKEWNKILSGETSLLKEKIKMLDEEASQSKSLEKGIPVP